MLKNLLAVIWHGWDTQDAWRNDPRPARKVGALLGLAWSIGMAAAGLWEASRPPELVETAPR